MSNYSPAFLKMAGVIDRMKANVKENNAALAKQQGVTVQEVENKDKADMLLSGLLLGATGGMAAGSLGGERLGHSLTVKKYPKANIGEYLSSSMSMSRESLEAAVKHVKRNRLVGSIGGAAVGGAAVGVPLGAYLIPKIKELYPKHLNKQAQEPTMPSNNENVMLPSVLPDPAEMHAIPLASGSPIGDPDDLPRDNRTHDQTLSPASEASSREGKEEYLRRYFAMGRKPTRDIPHTDLSFVIKRDLVGAGLSAAKTQEATPVAPQIEELEGHGPEKTASRLDVLFPWVSKTMAETR